MDTVAFYTMVIRDIEDSFYATPANDTSSDEQFLHSHLVALVKIVQLQAERAS